MNFRQLRTFVAIADYGGFARAAARLNLTQSAASRQILALEAELGVPLFDRIGRHVQLTSEGEDLLESSRRLLVDVNALGERARIRKGGQVGVLRVGSTAQFIESALVDFVVRHQRGHPGVEVRLIEDAGSRLPERLERGDVHLSIMSGGADRFHWRLLCPIYVLALLPKGHRLSRRAVLDVTDLAEEPLVLLNRSFASSEWFHAACQVAHIRPRVCFEGAAAGTVVALAAGGYGVAVIPNGVLIPREKVRAVPLLHRGTPIGRWRFVAWNPQRFLAPYAERFVAELMAHCRHNYPNRDLTRRAPPLPKPKEAAAGEIRSAR